MLKMKSPPFIHCIASLLAIVVALLTANSTALPQSMSSAQLQGVRGGEDFYCCVVITDPMGINCNSCVSDGNGKFVKCSPTSTDTTHGEFYNQIPPQKVTLTETPCGSSIAITYDLSSCTGNPYSYGTCFRTYTKGAAGLPPVF